MHTQLELQNIGALADWSSARDVVHALNLMGQSAQAQDYVVASGELRSVRDLLATAFGHVGLDWMQFASFQEDHTAPALVGLPQMLERALGWRRTLQFENVVAEMVDRDLAIEDALLKA